MKTFFTVILFAAATVSFSQGKYEQTMLETLQKMGNATNAEEFQNVANIFERISMNETKEWLPLYYAAQCYITMNFEEVDNTKKDLVLDKAQTFIDKAFKIAPNEPELYTLQAFLYPARMNIDPMSRGMQYLVLLNQTIEKAIQLNPENPRTYYLKAVIALNMPESFGGGAAVAKPIFEIAKAKFENYKPASPLHPNWGKEQNQAELDKLK